MDDGRHSQEKPTQMTTNMNGSSGLPSVFPEEDADDDTDLRHLPSESPPTDADMSVEGSQRNSLSAGTGEFTHRERRGSRGMSHEVRRLSMGMPITHFQAMALVRKALLSSFGERPRSAHIGGGDDEEDKEESEDERNDEEEPWEEVDTGEQDSQEGGKKSGEKQLNGYH